MRDHPKNQLRGESMFSRFLLPIIAAGLLVASCKQRTSSEVQSNRARSGSTGECPQTVNPAHCAGPFHVASFKVKGSDKSMLFDFKTTATADGGLEMPEFEGLPPNRFGTFELEITEINSSVLTRDMHYFLNETAEDPDTRIGVRPIPVVEGDMTSPMDFGNGVQVKGAELVDGYLRHIQKLNDDDYLFGLLSYSHPEEWKSTLKGLKDRLKTENGMTHLGAYVGSGKTRNSPENYHSKILWDGEQGYPTTFFTVGLDYGEFGERKGFISPSQANFNKNIIIVLRLLNELNDGVKFPGDYKFDWFKTYSLKTSLDFFHAWLGPVPGSSPEIVELAKKVRDDEQWETYCAEHLTIALNVAINVPQTRRGYRDAFGETVGPALWSKAQKMYKEITLKSSADNDWVLTKEELASGGAMPKVNYFTPLFKVRGVSRNHVRPPMGIAWPPQTSADLILDFAEMYAAWPDVSSVMSIGVVLGFIPELQKRMGIPPKKFLDGVKEPIRQMFKHEVLTVGHEASRIVVPIPEGAVAQFVAGRTDIPDAVKQQLSAISGPTKLATVAKMLDRSVAYDFYMMFVKSGLENLKKSVEPMNLTQSFNDAIIKKVLLDLQTNKSAYLAKPATHPDDAYADFRLTTASMMRKLRKLQPIASGDDKRVQFYSPPAVVHRTVSFMHPKDAFVKMNAVATLFDARELVFVPGKSEKVYDMGERLKAPDGAPSGH